MKNTTRDSAVLHALLEAAVDAIIVTDAKGVIVQANPAACLNTTLTTCRAKT